MINFLLGTFLAAGYLLMYWILGAAFPEKYRSQSMPVMCIMGFLLYYSLFQIVALPMKVAKLSLSSLTLSWGGILALILLATIICRRKWLWGSIKNCLNDIRKSGLSIVVIILALVIAIMLGLNTNTISDYDACYYIGLPVSSTYSNTLELMSTYTGEMLGEPESFYIFNTDTLHSAIIFQVLNLHPLVERKWSFTIAMALIFEMAVYLGGKRLFDEDDKKAALFFVLANMVLFFSYSLAGVSHYFAYRTYEGKAIVSYQYTIMIFMAAVMIYKSKREQWPWAILFMAAASGVAFCNTGIFVVPIMIGCTLLPYVITNGLMQKDWNVLKKYIVSIIPGIVWMLLYMIY